MKICTLLFVFFFSFCVLSAQTSLQEQRKLWGFSKWPQMFKDRAFCLCILEGYQDSALKYRILSLDKSFYDPIGYSIFDSTLLPSIQKEVETININAKRSYGSVSESKAGMNVFNHCLNFYKSKRLDKLVQKTLPGWYKIKNIGEMISRKMPAF